MAHSKITTCLWYDGQASEAAAYYTSIFPDSSVQHTTYYTSAGSEIHGHEPGSVLTVSFTLNGQSFVAMNGGPHFKFNEAVSFQVECKDQAEVDYYWEKLGAGGDEKRRDCGWIADRWGVSWQVVPQNLFKYIKSGERERVERVMAAMMKMVKMDVEALDMAWEGKE